MKTQEEAREAEYRQEDFSQENQSESKKQYTIKEGNRKPEPYLLQNRKTQRERFYGLFWFLFVFTKNCLPWLKRKTWTPAKMRCSEHKENSEYQNNLKHVTFKNRTVITNFCGRSMFHFNYKSDRGNSRGFRRRFTIKGPSSSLCLTCVSPKGI